MNNLGTNDIFNTYFDIIRNTSHSVFLTGKAGTGKTTFLRYVYNNVYKNTIIAAPTGVAAINAGGVTLHSLLQLPFEPFIPTYEGKQKLDFHFKFRKSKIDMLRELELLIIDEVSMLRADMLDAVDYMLRRYRNNNQPFGGVQMLYIGDLFQLPPVVQPQEWSELRTYYSSPLFISAHVLENNPPLCIELTTVYRQQDIQFIDILNKVRNNVMSHIDFQILNEHYKPSFSLTEGDGYIVLCTHNYKADKINNEQIKNLSGEFISFDATSTGEFTENAFPVDSSLMLKLGAQVMFVKNDTGEKKRYYNGKLAVISRLTHKDIYVRFQDGSELKLESETWRNIRYTLDAQSGEIVEEEIGSFTQYPIRLAWAVTIHKSQGLTFDKVVIDAGEAFAPGQVYVALSRCTSLQGIVLLSKITPQSIRTNEEAVAFHSECHTLDYLNSILAIEKPRYCAQKLKEAFDWSLLVSNMDSFYELVSEKKIPKKEEVLSMVTLLQQRAKDEQQISINFQKELDSILSTTNVDFDRLKDRVRRAVLYFYEDIQQYILIPIENHLLELKNASKVKSYLKSANNIHTSVLKFLSKLEDVHYGNESLTRGIDLPVIERTEVTPEDTSKNKPTKGGSIRTTLLLFNQGMSVTDIAKERNLAASTVQVHLIDLITTGDVSLNQILSQDKIDYLLSQIKANETMSMKELKEKLPPEYTYFDIRAALNHLSYLKKS